jgi:hypothetical protein
METKICRCGGEMKGGGIYITHNENAVLFNYAMFVEGEKDELISYMKTMPPQFPVKPFKCSQCGLIEFYAEAPQKWKH